MGKVSSDSVGLGTDYCGASGRCVGAAQLGAADWRQQLRNGLLEDVVDVAREGGVFSGPGLGHHALG